MSNTIVQGQNTETSLRARSMQHLNQFSTCSFTFQNIGVQTFSSIRRLRT